MNKAAIRIRIRQICCLGLAEELLATALVPAVRDLVSSESGAFAWMDRHGKVTNVYSDRLSSMRLVAAVPELRDSPVAVTDWGAHRILCGVVRNTGTELAHVSVCRPAGSDFSAAEIADLSSVMHYISHGVALGRKVARASNDSMEFEDSPEEALVIADRRGVLKHATEEGRRMLLLAAGVKINSAALSSAPFIASDLLKSVCGPLEGSDPRVKPEPRSTVCRTNWGRFVLRAYPLNDDPASEGDLMGVRIQRQEPAMIKVVRAISRLPLSPQQRQIALLIAQGMSNRQIATSLSVSCNTVAYHVRQLFMKLGVHDRGSMIGRIAETFA